MKMKIKLIALVLMSGILVSGCGARKANIDPVPGDPILKEKKVFLDRYYNFIIPAEAEAFKLLTTVPELDTFVDEFWKKRDIDPATPENEFKAIIDSRIADIENEIFMTDFDIPGTRFNANSGRGLRSDMAKVYLFYGTPHYKEKLNEGRLHVEMMVWYYFDINGRPLFRFLFYQKYGTTMLFKNHMAILDANYLFDPLSSPLRELSSRSVPTAEDLYQLWYELEFQDPEWAFRSALLEFSSYSDVVMEGGKPGKSIGALDAPEPVRLTAVRFKPTIVGQPPDLTGRQFVYSRYKSFIPAILRLRSGFILVKYGDLDWEIINDKSAEFLLNIKVSFQDKSTKEIIEFDSVINRRLKKDHLDKINMTAKEFLEKNADVAFGLPFLEVFNKITGNNLASAIEQLKPGTYIVNVDLRHEVTKKYAGGWREELVIK
jgi:GWxTD domain-containing protein